MNKQMILFILAVVIIGALIFIGYRSGGNTQDQVPTTQTAAIGTLSPENPLIIQDTVVGTGAEAKTGDTVAVQYVGTLTDGTKFDSSIDRGEPFSFTLGAGQVIPGWDQGIVGMKEGGTRMLLIAPELAYGAQAVGPIPANSALQFEVQLIKVESSASSTPETSEATTTTKAE